MYLCLKKKKSTICRKHTMKNQMFRLFCKCRFKLSSLRSELATYTTEVGGNACVSMQSGHSFTLSMSYKLEWLHSFTYNCPTDNAKSFYRFPSCFMHTARRSVFKRPSTELPTSLNAKRALTVR